MDRIHTMPFGCIPTAQGTEFRIWAPNADSVTLVLEHVLPRDLESTEVVPKRIELLKTDDGFFAMDEVEAGPGSLYRYEINGSLLVPDPASRYQPSDVHGPSCVVDPNEYKWRAREWKGRPWEEVILYELHVGTFSQEGSFESLIAYLDELSDIGFTAIELMPVSDFKGFRNWGYDGVLPFAPDTSYGSFNDLKLLIDEAHLRGLMVFLDVVYNHFGPEGNYLHTYAGDFFTDEFKTPWGKAIDFAQVQVRDFFIHNALYWIEEYCIDGLRLDAVHAIKDKSKKHILYELAERVQAEVPSDREVHLVLENDKNEARYLGTESKGLYKAQWNDDFHHVCHYLLTGEDQGYYSDYSEDTVGKLARSLNEGFVYQGQKSSFRGGISRGEKSSQLPAYRFVNFLQNHDQVGNRAFGERLRKLTDEKKYDFAAHILLLSPQIPLVFMGEEWGIDVPFYYFCDYEGELAEAVKKGRRREFSSFKEFQDEEKREQIPDPNNLHTFLKSKLPWDNISLDEYLPQRKKYQKLLTLRKRYLLPRLAQFSKSLSEQLFDKAYRISWEFGNASSWILVFNLGKKHMTFQMQREEEEIITYGECKKIGSMTFELGPWSLAFLNKGE